MERHRTVVAAATLTVLLGGCSDQPAVEDAESELIAHYLDPLVEGGMGYTIDSTCNLDGGTAYDKWHLVIDIHVTAPRSKVAVALEDAGAVVRQDRNPAVVQQSPGRPESGWNGALTRDDAGTRLGLTYNNVAVPAVTSALGWAEACPAEVR